MFLIIVQAAFNFQGQNFFAVSSYFKNYLENFLTTFIYFALYLLLFFLLKGYTSLNNKIIQKIKWQQIFKPPQGNSPGREESPKSPWWNAPKIWTTLLLFYVINPMKGTHILKLKMILYHYMYLIHLFTPYKRVDTCIRYMIDFLLKLE